MRNPLTIEALVGWLEQQPAAGEYDYSNNCNCLMAQYLRAQGFSVHHVVPGLWAEHDREEYHTLPDGFEDVATGVSDGAIWTYGAALERARALLGA